MPAIVIDLAVLLALLYCVWLGADKGLVLSAATGVEILWSLVVALLLHESIAGTIGGGVEKAIGPFLPRGVAYEAYAVFFAFAGMLWGLLACLWLTVHQRLIASDFETLPLADRIGGGIAGGMAGMLLVGAILLTWSTCPLLSGMRFPAAGMNFDVGRVVLGTVGGFMADYHEGRSVVLYGEPVASRSESHPQLALASETWFDRGEAGDINEAEDSFFDLDDDGSFTKDLYYLDLDDDGSRRVGLVEKYVIGRWDGYLASNSRPLPAAERPEPTVVRETADQEGRPTIPAERAVETPAAKPVPTIPHEPKEREDKGKSDAPISDF